MPDVTALQNIFLAYIALRKQRLETLKVVALCKASLAGVDLRSGSSSLYESAGKALERYVRKSEHLLQEEVQTEKELQKVLEREASKAYVIGTSQASYKDGRRPKEGGAYYGRTELHQGERDPTHDQ